MIAQVPGRRFVLEQPAARRRDVETEKRAQA